MISVDKYVIMPNHIHLILMIDGVNGRAMHAPIIKSLILFHRFLHYANGVD